MYLIIYAQGVTMEMKYWIEFAQNSKPIKRIIFRRISIPMKEVLLFSEDIF
jgi:hypothetical protein